jgi:hypothetical protein
MVFRGERENTGRKGMNNYEKKQEARKEHYLEQAEKARREAAQLRLL